MPILVFCVIYSYSYFTKCSFHYEDKHDNIRLAKVCRDEVINRVMWLILYHLQLLYIYIPIFFY